jgi:arylsulfatase
MILFVSDNGACPYDRKAPLLNVEPTNGDVALADSTGWSWARNAPFRFYKQNQYEGGISSPGIVHWPDGLKTEAGAIVDTPAHLIDVLPTLADLAGAEIPTAHPTRALRPVSGVSLRPVFEGEALARAEPIHFQFASDYGLREGDWKLVSFKGQAWELYHLGNDRAEVNNLAEAEPKRLNSMVAKWRQMSKDVLNSEKLANAEIKPAEIPKTNREWTTYSDSDRPPVRKPARVGRGPSKDGVRARKNTLLKAVPGAWELTFTGEDPGIAIDLRGMKNLEAGPYTVTFDLVTEWQGTGEIFFTTDGKTVLPNGTRIEFPVAGGGKTQSATIELATTEALKQLRLDVAEGPGSATIGRLRLLSREGEPLHEWTPPAALQ